MSEMKEIFDGIERELEKGNAPIVRNKCLDYAIRLLEAYFSPLAMPYEQRKDFNWTCTLIIRRALFMAEDIQDYIKTGKIPERK